MITTDERQLNQYILSAFTAIHSIEVTPAQLKVRPVYRFEDLSIFEEMSPERHGAKFDAIEAAPSTP